MSRQPAPLGILAISLIYWGSLFYWRWDELTGDDTAAMNLALQGIVLSVVYVGLLLLALTKDLPEGIRQIRYIGGSLKFFIWLSTVLALAYWAWLDDSLVGFNLVGISLMGLGTAMILSCLLYTGDESSRLYGLQKIVDVYP